MKKLNHFRKRSSIYGKNRVKHSAFMKRLLVKQDINELKEDWYAKRREIEDEFYSRLSKLDEHFAYNTKCPHYDQQITYLSGVCKYQCCSCGEYVSDVNVSVS
jgi:hypothetical protein